MSLRQDASLKSEQLVLQLLRGEDSFGICKIWVQSLDLPFILWITLDKLFTFSVLISFSVKWGYRSPSTGGHGIEGSRDVSAGSTSLTPAASVTTTSTSLPPWKPVALGLGLLCYEVLRLPFAILPPRLSLSLAGSALIFFWNFQKALGSAS